MSDNQPTNRLDIVREVLGLDVDETRLDALLEAYGDVLGEITKLRTLDLTDVQPAVIFRVDGRDSAR